MKRIAVLVIAATGQPVYKHYIETYWTKFIEYTNQHKPNIDVYLLFQKGTDVSEFEYLNENIIVDENTEFYGFFGPDDGAGAIPGILSKTLYAFEQLQDDYDVFFRTNLSSMLHTTNFENLVESKNPVIYSGGAVWTDFLRKNLVHNGRVGKGNRLRSLKELDSYPGNTFISGSAYFISAAEAKQLIAEKSRLRYDLADDVAVGLMMAEHEYLLEFTLRLLPTESIGAILDKLNNSYYCHIRLEHFPPEKAQQIWQHLYADKFWDGVLAASGDS